MTMTETARAVTFEVPAQILAASYAAVSLAVYTSGDKPDDYALRGVLFERDEEGLRLIATDAYRLHIAEIPPEVFGADLPPVGWSALIRHRKETTRDLKAAAKGYSVPPLMLTIGDGETGATFTTPDRRIHAPTMDSAYPDYRRILNAAVPGIGCDDPIAWNPDFLAEIGKAVKEARIFARSNGGPVRLISAGHPSPVGADTTVWQTFTSDVTEPSLTIALVTVKTR